MGFIYLFTDPLLKKRHVYKIGKTKNLVNRLSSFRTSNPDGFFVKTWQVDNIHISEKKIHGYYKDLGKHYKLEWYKLRPLDGCIDTITEMLNRDNHVYNTKLSLATMLYDDINHSHNIPCPKAWLLNETTMRACFKHMVDLDMPLSVPLSPYDKSMQYIIFMLVNF